MTRNLKENFTLILKSINWVDWLGNSVGVGTGGTVLELSREEIAYICHGDKFGDPATLRV